MTHREPAHGSDQVTIEEAVRNLPGWSRGDGRLAKTFVHDDFHSSALFVERLAIAAEAVGRQPDLAISGARVTVTLGDRAAGTLTGDDVALARRIERLVGDQHRHPVGLAGP
jgi:4a-hydroxytetrahydrobiopterin dehydratase